MELFTYCGFVVCSWLAVELYGMIWHYFLHRKLPLSQKDLLIKRMEDRVKSEQQVFEYKEKIMEKALAIESERSRQLQEEKEEMIKSIISKM